MKQKRKRLFFSVMIVGMLSIHLIKCYSSFNNNYICDLRDHIRFLKLRYEQDDIYIYNKEFKRISDNTGLTESDITYSLLNSFSLNTNNVHELYLKNSNFPHNLFLIVTDQSFYEPVSYLDYSNQSSLKLVQKVGSYSSNASSKKKVNVIKHNSFIPKPQIDSDHFYEGGVLLNYIPEHDTFIYKKGNRIIWLVGKELDQKTELVFRFYNSPQDVLSGFQKAFYNQSFRKASQSERERIGRYRVYSKLIPSIPLATIIQTGFIEPDGTIIRTRCFPVVEMHSVNRDNNRIKQ